MNVRVCNLFTPDFIENSRELKARYNLGKIVAKGKMKKTVVAVLDACVSPSIPCLTTDWSYMPIEKERELEERLWPKEPRADLRYRYSYQILECDVDGRSGQNPHSDSPSTFHIISNYGDSSTGEGVAKHMLFRNLIRSKWERYGQRTVLCNMVAFLVYLLALTVGLTYSARHMTRISNTTTICLYDFKNSEDVIRLVSEIVYLVFTLIYLINEIYHLWWNVQIRIKCDKTGTFIMWAKVLPLPALVEIAALISIIATWTLQIANLHAYSLPVASLAYLVICAEVFTYFCLNKTYGIYKNTLKEIIKIDILQYFVVIIPIVLMFSVSLFVMASALHFKPEWGIWSIVMLSLRAFVEGKEFEEDEIDYPVLFFFLLLVSMFMIMIVMGNLLIAQITDRYSKAKRIAEVQCEVDRAKMLTRIESLPMMRGLRERNYMKEMYVRHEELAKDLREDATCYAPKGTQSEDVQTLIGQNILKWGY